MDIILTGIARSGTTLTCSLLNMLPQCVALHEPMNPSSLSESPFPHGYLEQISAFYAEQRVSLMEHGRAVSKARGGSIPDNPFESTIVNDRLRPSTVQNQEVDFGKNLKEGFRLVVKHPNFFTATLSVLKDVYQCYAIVRNPLAVLLSWHTIQAPVNQGRLPYGEAFDARLKSDLSSESDRLERQIIILKWYFTQYSSHLAPRHVIKYEDLVASGGRALAVIDPDAVVLTEQLKSRNVNAIYDAKLVCHLSARLLADESIYSGFYGRSDIDQLSAAWTQTGVNFSECSEVDAV